MDVKWIIEDPEKVKAGAEKKHIKCDVDKVVKLYSERNEKLQKIEELRAQQNAAPKNPSEEDIAKMKKIKEEIKTIDPELEKLEEEIDATAALVPNPTFDSVPDGKDDSENEVVNTHGKKPEFDFTPIDHIELGK